MMVFADYIPFEMVPFPGANSSIFGGGVHDFQSFSDLQFLGFFWFPGFTENDPIWAFFQLGFETRCYKDY